MLGVLIVKPRDGSWWVSLAGDVYGAGWPCATRDQAIAVAHSIARSSGGGDVVVHDANGSVARKDSVSAQPQHERRQAGERLTIVQMPDGTKRTVSIDPERARKNRRVFLNGRGYCVVAVDTATEPPLAILEHDDRRSAGRRRRRRRPST